MVNADDPAVFKNAFSFFLVRPPRGGCGGGSGLSFSYGDRGFGADSGPDPWGNLILVFILALNKAVMNSTQV